MLRQKWIASSILSISTLLTLSTPSMARVTQVRVINHATQPIYIHVGGFAPSKTIQPGKWKIFRYPFKVVPPNSQTKHPINVSLLVASAGGHWVTNPEGITHLEKPSMLLCLDYGNQSLSKMSGNRKWEIKQTGGFDKGCKVKSYKQPWYQASSSTASSDGSSDVNTNAG